MVCISNNGSFDKCVVTAGSFNNEAQPTLASPSCSSGSGDQETQILRALQANLPSKDYAKDEDEEGERNFNDALELLAQDLAEGGYSDVSYINAPTANVNFSAQKGSQKLKLKITPIMSKTKEEREKRNPSIIRDFVSVDKSININDL